MKYKAYSVSLIESGREKGKINGMSEIDRKSYLIGLLNREPEKILLECRGDNYFEKYFEGFLIDAPKNEKLFIEGFEPDNEKIRRGSPLDFSIWTSTEFPTIRWEVKIEWSKENNSWIASK